MQPVHFQGVTCAEPPHTQTIHLLPETPLQSPLGRQATPLVVSSREHWVGTAPVQV